MPPEDARSELVRQWLTKVDHDLVAADRMAEEPAVPDAVSFHCQQAAEKALKAFLIWRSRPFRKTHVLRELVLQCADLDGTFIELLEAAAVLTPYAVESRYPDDLVDPTIEDAREARTAAQDVVTFVRERLPPAVHP